MLDRKRVLSIGSMKRDFTGHSDLFLSDRGRWRVFPEEGTKLKISSASVLFSQLCMDLFLKMG